MYHTKDNPARVFLQTLNVIQNQCLASTELPQYVICRRYQVLTVPLFDLQSVFFLPLWLKLQPVHSD